MSARIRIAVSSCLIGQEVRYDGGHRRSEYITATLGKIFEFVPYCPEVAIGMGVPRPPIRLVKVGRDVRAQGVEDATQDVTEKLLAYADKVAPKLHAVSGYILKKNSPSCGIERVKLYTLKGRRAGTSRGIYAGRLQDLHPAMPFEDEARLMDPARRENFLERVFVYHRWQQFTKRRLTAKRLAGFHAQIKPLLMVRDTKAARALDRLVANAVRDNAAALGQRYIQQLMRALSRPGRGRLELRVDTLPKSRQPRAVKDHA